MSTFKRYQADLILLEQVKETLGQEDKVLSLNNATRRIQQVTVIDVTITCHMSFRRFPFEAQSCPFEVLDVERPPVGIFKMVTSEIQFSNWPLSFSPTESEFEYKVYCTKALQEANYVLTIALNFSGLPPPG